MAKRSSLMRVFSRKSSDEEERFNAMLSSGLRPSAFISNMDEDEDNASSIDSISTTATADDLPGAGRVMDTYFYQPVGRKIERFAMRISIRFLHPSRILAFIQDGDNSMLSLWLWRKASLGTVMASIDLTTGSGLKSLVRQAQSKNIYRSMAALTSLIHIVIIDVGGLYGFFPAAAEVEPFISHAESLVEALDDCRPEKRYFRALVCLAKATTLLYRPEEVPDDFDRDIKKRLIELMHEYRSGQLDLLTALTDTCYLLAICASCLDFYNAHERVEFVSAIESAYFLLIFISHLLDELLYCVNRDPLYSEYARPFTSTLLTWLDDVLSALHWSIYPLRHCSVTQLQIVASLRCLSSILINKYNLIRRRTLTYFDPDYLPRKIRITGIDYWRDAPIIEALVRSFAPRTFRLLRHKDELEWEVLDTNSLRRNEKLIQSKDSIDSQHQLIDEELQRTLDLARRARSNVPLNDLTREFHEACVGSTWMQPYRWKVYKEKCKIRHWYGQHFRSNLDWNWNLAACLKRLYKLPRKRTEAVPTSALREDTQHPNASTSVEAESKASLTGDLLEAVVDGAVDGVIHKVRVAIRSPTGEVSYRTLRVIDQHCWSSGFGDELGDTKDGLEPEMKTTGHSEPDKMEACLYAEPSEVPVRPSTVLLDYDDQDNGKEQDHSSSEGEAVRWRRSEGHRTQDTFVEQHSEKDIPEADGQASLYSFL